ncbi:hypothetical protein Pmani_012330 [Petrolisthes manimaculis]|uniref:Peptidase S1 domain-containing protein n=1 Tax=Petrolisthes manimaculis TaxID=1843537 RepID=A0AAE1Q131_9EUCA|nr:hypothetical protein Pmani_012330 [Petrolisthes manimaculis]
MIRFILCFCFVVSVLGVGVASPPGHTRIHTSQHKSERITNGAEARPHTWPHQVALIINGGFYCGGSLISNEWVLTAAHCVDDGAPFVEVILGAHNWRVEEPTQVKVRSAEVMWHEDWNPITLANDLALVRLSEPVTFNDNIQAVKLPSSDVPIGATLIATGWGMSYWETEVSDVLRQIETTVITNEECNTYTIIGVGGEAKTHQTRYPLTIIDGMLCTDGSKGTGTCNGDSGGPLNLNGMTYGITSYASCGDGPPDTFTRVYNYVDWITTKTGITP